MHNSESSLRSNTKRVRGLGSSHDGTGHWWLQRLTAGAMIPLSVWFTVQLVTHLIGADATAISAWLKNPLVAMALLIFVVSMFTHARLGVQVIIEDYVHCETKKIALLLFTNATVLVAGLACVFAIVRLHFIGA